MTKAAWIPRLTFWRVVFFLVVAVGVQATYIRIAHGLGAATNLTDQFPWGLWIGFDVLCGVGLAAGGFTLAATVHIFNIEKYKPIARPAILTAFLGYLLVILALAFDLGLPWRVWRVLTSWHPSSVMFEIGWCVALYTTVLALEFTPVVFERLGWTTPLRWMQPVMIPLVIAGVILSTLHQSSLGSLYLIVPNKLYPLWYTPMLPIHFFVSAVSVGLAMTIFESWHSSKAFGRQLELPLLAGMARVLAVLLAVFMVMRFTDLLRRGVLALVLQPRTESYLFLLETALMFVPMLLLFRRRIRSSATSLYVCAIMVIFGFVTHRLNVSITGMEASSGVSYLPKWTEAAVTLMIIAFGFAIFWFAAKWLPVFAESPHPVHEDARRLAGRAEPAVAPGD